jgi:hypothetical protein
MSQGKLNGTPSAVPMPTSGNASNTLMGQGPLGTTGPSAPQNYQYQFGGSTGAPVIGGMSSMTGQAPQQINLQGQSGSAPTLQSLQDQIAKLTQQLTALQSSGSSAPQAAPSTSPGTGMFSPGNPNNFHPLDGMFSPGNPNNFHPLDGMFSPGNPNAQPIQNAAGGINPAINPEQNAMTSAQTDLFILPQQQYNTLFGTPHTGSIVG